MDVGVDVGESSGPASVGRIVNRDGPRILLSSRRQLRPCRSNSIAGDLLGFHRRVGRSRECAILREKISPAIIVVTGGCARIRSTRPLGIEFYESLKEASDRS